MGMQRIVIAPFLLISAYNNEVQNLKILWTPGSNLALPDIHSRNETTDEYQHPQLQHKKLATDIQFFDDQEEQITYKKTTKKPQLIRLTISVLLIAKKARIRKCSNCIMLVK